MNIGTSLAIECYRKHLWAGAACCEAVAAAAYSVSTYKGDRFPGAVKPGSLILDATDLRQNIEPRLTAHQNDQHGKPEVANVPESAIRPLVSCARAKRGRDEARRSCEAGRAPSKTKTTSHQ